MPPPPLEPAAVPVLDYGPPRRSTYGLRIWFGFGVVLFAIGCGLAAFGVMMAMGFRDDYAGPAGIGVGLIVCGLFFMLGAVYYRFVPRRP